MADFDILHAPNHKLYPALQRIGNICSGTDKQTQVVIDSSCLRSISQHFDPKKSRAVLKEAGMRLLSNICAGRTDQIQAMIEAGLLPVIVATIKISKPVDVKTEAVLGCAYSGALKLSFVTPLLGWLQSPTI